MKKIYRGWWISTIDKEQMQAVKGKERIIGTEQQIKCEIDRRRFEEMKEKGEKHPNGVR